MDGVQVVARGTEGNEANGDVAGSAHVLYVYTHAKAARPNKYMDVRSWRMLMVGR